MARSKSSVSTFLAPFRRQAYQSWYLDGYTLVQFTKLMDILFQGLEKITFVKISASERQWRTCKTVWDSVWNIKERGIPQEAGLGLDDLHIWFCKSPGGTIMWKPLKLGPLTLATLLPGLATASEVLHLAGQPLKPNQMWHDNDDNAGRVREHKSVPSCSQSANSVTIQHYSEAGLSDTPVPDAHDTALISYSQQAETDVSMEGTLGAYTPYSQLNDSACVLTGQAVSETASSVNNGAPCCTMSRHRGTNFTQNGPAKHCAEWPDYVNEGCQCVHTSNNPDFDLYSTENSQIDWLAAINF